MSVLSTANPSRDREKQKIAGRSLTLAVLKEYAEPLKAGRGRIW
jgi:hypothetical protein